MAHVSVKLNQAYHCWVSIEHDFFFNSTHLRLWNLHSLLKQHIKLVVRESFLFRQLLALLILLIGLSANIFNIYILQELLLDFIDKSLSDLRHDNGVFLFLIRRQDNFLNLKTVHVILVSFVFVLVSQQMLIKELLIYLVQPLSIPANRFVPIK